MALGFRRELLYPCATIKPFKTQRVRIQRVEVIPSLRVLLHIFPRVQIVSRARLSRRRARVSRNTNAFPSILRKRKYHWAAMSRGQEGSTTRNAKVPVPKSRLFGGEFTT